MREGLLVGVDHLNSATRLLQRVRGAHATFGLYEAAELQWWWTIRRSTDSIGQLFWFDELGHPEAAVVVTDFGDGSSAVYGEPIIVVIVMPGSSPEWIAHVVERGLAHVRSCGIDEVALEVDQTDEVMRSVLVHHGFSRSGDGVVQCWLDASARPKVSPLPAGYRLLDRGETSHLPHHMAHPGRPDVDQRLRETPLYRPDLDLVVMWDDADTGGTDEPVPDRDGADEKVAAHGLFWVDEVTATGVVEPMRTLDGHQRRGLARHVLTAGIDRLAAAGATRVSIAFEPDNTAARHLYLDVGFVPHRQTDAYSGRLA